MGLTIYEDADEVLDHTRSVRKNDEGYYLAASLDLFLSELEERKKVSETITSRLRESSEKVKEKFVSFANKDEFFDTHFGKNSKYKELAHEFQTVRCLNFLDIPLLMQELTDGARWVGLPS